ncbi:Aste57867_21515 [Aphanomyces stellatus]|uniref:Aste57867_21515 protein n=1 Tax=Aphanomyces stellatus TaxID=120398 RepID=A0A485LMJ8_9STRA|nr:hypothetical protein As57867_021446 [Aphanomyces stellatus]VFT98185.1 Aste57867_21515 [Aphanomyces stellatus]
MKTPDQAAALIQARWKGRAYRIRQRHYVEAITIVQALQRGRAVRCDFAQYKAFRREQAREPKAEQSKARRERIWQQQQQLLYMESAITPERSERLLAIRRRRGARLIQRRWKEHAESSSIGRQRHAWDDDDDDDDDASSVASDGTTAAVVAADVFLAKKQAICMRVQQKVRQWSEKHPWKLVESSDASKAEKTQARLDTYRKLQTDTQALRQRVQTYCATVRQPRRDQPATAATRVAQCERRLHALMHPPPLPTATIATDNATAPSLPALPKSKARRVAATKHHDAIVSSVAAATKTYEMPVAGTVYDMRHRRPPPSWAIAGHDKVWTWPHATAAVHTDSNMDPHVETFLGGASTANEVDDDALIWPLYASRTRDTMPLVPSMVTHPALLACLNQPSKMDDDAYGTTFAATVSAQSQHVVADVTSQIQFNTQLRMAQDKTKDTPSPPPPSAADDEDDVEAVLGTDYARLRRDYMATRIQRRVRGLQGRQHANTIRAEYFVMVRGHAVRKGVCEECGDVPAVLQCNACEESTHFCPGCWVHVHSTRRRRLHVPVPMAVAPPPATALPKPAAVAPRPTAAIVSPLTIQHNQRPPQIQPHAAVATPSVAATAADTLLFQGVDTMQSMGATSTLQMVHLMSEPSVNLGNDATAMTSQQSIPPSEALPADVLLFGGVTSTDTKEAPVHAPPRTTNARLKTSPRHAQEQAGGGSTLAGPVRRSLKSRVSFAKASPSNIIEENKDKASAPHGTAS